MQGTTGITGVKGDSGIAGLEGFKGFRGEKGQQGIQGEEGIHVRLFNDSLVCISYILSYLAVHRNCLFIRI